MKLNQTLEFRVCKLEDRLEHLTNNVSKMVIVFEKNKLESNDRLDRLFHAVNQLKK